MAVKIIREKLTQQSELFTNTLCRSIHPLFQKEPNHAGLGIDHIFTKNISVLSCDVQNVVISDHLPLILQFEI
jgi:endonuclease/exonuclease/phosphatase (EEP) superfamily protein YafD